MAGQQREETTSDEPPAYDRLARKCRRTKKKCIQIMLKIRSRRETQFPIDCFRRQDPFFNHDNGLDRMALRVFFLSQACIDDEVHKKNMKTVNT